jgi:hypothetical protein
MSMFGTVLDKAQGLFSRGFLLGAYFPVLIFAALNLTIAYFGLRGPDDTFATVKKAWWPSEGADQATLTAAVLMTLGVVAYVLSTLTNVLRGLLEGEFLGPMRLALIGKHQQEVDTRQQGLDQTKGRLIGFESLKSRLDNELNEAAAAANPNAPVDEQRIKRAEELLQRTRSRSLGEDTRHERLDNAIVAVVAAARNNPLGGDRAEAQAVEARLDDVLQVLRGELDGAIAEAGRDYANAWSNIHENYVPNDVRPTRIGNLRAVTESYSDKAYGVRFDYLWPRLQPLLAKDDKVAQLVELAKAQLDSAVLMLSLTIGSTAVWFVVLAVWGTSPWPFLAVAALGPAAMSFFSVMVAQTQAVFGASVQSTIDVFRLDLLARLHIPLPDRLSSERARWDALQQMANDAVALADLVYDHRKS